MTNTDDTYDVIGDSYRADAWYNRTDGKHTVSVTYHTLKGDFKMQGTLSIDPTADDWFDITFTSGDTVLSYNGESATEAYSFVGNFMFVRAVLDRSSRQDLSSLDGKAKPDQGRIDKVILAL